MNATAAERASGGPLFAAGRAVHFGPSTTHVGGMGSVIANIVRGGLGAERVDAFATWVPGSHSRSAVLTARAAAVVSRLPAGTVVHLHMSERGSFLRETSVLAAAKMRGLPCVVTIHGAEFADFSRRHRRLVAAALGMANVVTVLSEVDRQAVERLGVPAHVELVPNPCALDREAGRAADTEELVLFAGEVGKRKGADVLREAWPLVAARRPQARCLIVGPATELRLASTPGLELRGPVPPHQVQTLIRRARAIVLPSRGEALPMILTEAMAAGRPFVSTPTGGIAAIKEGGLLVPVDDAEALAAALTGLLADPQLAQRIGDSGRELCRLELSPEVIDARMRAVYARAREPR